MDKQMQTFSFNPPNILVEEGKWLLAVTSFECTNCVFNITDRNNSFSIGILSRWRKHIYLEDGIIDKLNNLLELKSDNDIGLHVEEVRKRSHLIKIGDKESKLSTLILLKKKYSKELTSNNYDNLEDLVYRMQLTFDEIMDVLDTKYFPAQRTVHTLPPGIYGIRVVEVGADQTGGGRPYVLR